jgi:hypothetical protein
MSEYSSQPFVSLKKDLHSGAISFTTFAYAWEALATVHSAVLRKQFSDKGFVVSGTDRVILTLKTDDEGAKWQLSIIFPSDASPGILETALLHNGHIVYIDELGYNDVCRFNVDFAEVLAEALRVKLWFDTSFKNK